MANDERRTDKQGDAPSDTERLVGDTAASEPLTDQDRVQPGDAESRKEHEHGNPPHTSTKKITSPAFGSAVSGGALADPGPPKN